MLEKLKRGVTFLDLVLLLMTAFWVIRGVYVGINFVETVYNYIYVIVNIATLILNLIVINWDRK